MGLCVREERCRILKVAGTEVLAVAAHFLSGVGPVARQVWICCYHVWLQSPTLHCSDPAGESALLGCFDKLSFCWDKPE